MMPPLFTPGGSQTLHRITTLGPEGVGTVMSGFKAQLTTNTWGTNNMGIYSPIVIDQARNVRALFMAVNTTANVDMGLYNAAGTRLISTGAGAGAGTPAYDERDVTDFIIGPGLYYLAASIANGAGQLVRATTTAAFGRSLGMWQEASAHPLPATATFATYAQAHVPLIGIKCELVG